MGFIGGPDGPMAIFVSGSPVMVMIELLAVIALAGAGFYWFRHKRNH